MNDRTDVAASDIAIIGMGLRVPGATSVDEFWRNLRTGVESIRTLTNEELLAAGESAANLSDKNYVARTADLGGMEMFDPGFFGFGRQEAAIMDPQHRQFLECAWEAIESSARPPRSLSGPVGVFAGCGMGSYFYFNVCSNEKLVDQVGMFLLRHTGNDKDFLATRLSHVFDLRGPSVNVQTACSTSLVAVHYACQSLINGECDMALAGGVTIDLPHRRGYLYRDNEILSPDGRCRAFDHRAAGTVFGSGAGVVVLRRLSDAIADGDPIRAVIKATAINNDGASKAGYLAPSVTGQAEAIVEAQALAGITADTVQYVECHGTGTKIGDPIEIEALTQAFRHSTDRNGYCLVGSVKSNIGHLDTAAGVVSLIKATLAVEAGEIPPTLGYEKPNPSIDFASTPFRVCDRLTRWPAGGGPRRAGVNSLGVGGTNAHAIVEQAPARKAPADAGSDGPQFLVLSAKSRAALEASSRRLADYLEAAGNGVRLSDVASTLFHGRTHFAHRCVVPALDRTHAVSALRAIDRNWAAHTLVEGASAAVFLFPGGGAQYAGMAQSLYHQDNAFRATVDEGLSFLPAAVAHEIRSLWFGKQSDADFRFRDPALQLPAILIAEVAVARLWMDWGIKPGALIGHSMGEYAAACIAGVFSFRNAVELVHLRGQLFNEIPPGGMLSVALSEQKLLALLDPGLDIASVNSPELCVVSGDNASLDRFQKTLSEQGIDCTRVPINIAAHSRMLEPILERFESYLKATSLSKPKIPIVSNLTGDWLTDAQARDPAYWRAHLRSRVKFVQGMALLAQDQTRIYIETGPGRSMASLVKAQGSVSPNQVINSLPHADDVADDRLHFMGAVGRAWSTGLTVPLERLWTGVDTRRVILPTYPFQHESLWIARNESPRSGRASSLKHDAIDDWFAIPTWMKSTHLSQSGALADASSGEPRRWLVYSDGSTAASNIVKQLAGTVIVVENGAKLKKVSSARWTLDFASPAQHQALLDEIAKEDFQPTDAIYCCGLAGPRIALGLLPARDDIQQKLQSSFYIPTHIVRALGHLGDAVNFTVVTRGLAQIADEPIDPLRAPLTGPVLVAPRETPQIRTRCIDIQQMPLERGERRAGQSLVDELLRPPTDRLVALRGTSRWVPSLHKIRLPAPPPATTWLRDGGVYVITGGLGGIALEMADHMARLANVKLALLARSQLPPDTDWDSALRVLPAHSHGAQRIHRLRAIKELGAEVAVFACDVTDHERVTAALEQVRARFGPISGVIHAAGTMDDEPIESKSTDSMHRVLHPKIAGAIHLDRSIGEPLDFFVLFSSVSSSLGLPGQVDYSAANAFLDSFAIDRASRTAGRTLVVNWNAWRDIGMAARANAEQQGGRAPSSVTAHPALDGYTDDPELGRTFVTDFEIDRHWLLSEHKLKTGISLLSGTTFVELARAAFCADREPCPIEIADLTFLTPFQVALGTTRRLAIQIAAQGGASEITMRSAGDDTRASPHVIGDVSLHEGPAPAPVDISAIIARCTIQHSVQRGGWLDQNFVEFGPRWKNIRSIRFGRQEALLDLALDPVFASDLDHYQLHPAMLDNATAGAQRLIPGFDASADFYVPVAYGRLRLFDRMPQRFFSYVRLRPESGSGEAFFDVTLIDRNGQPFCEIVRFGMKRIDTKSGFVEAAPRETRAAGGETALAKVLRDAILPSEGLQAFDRMMAQPNLVRCIASSVDIVEWERSLALDTEHAAVMTDEDDAGFSRPELASAYEAPETESEKFLARIFSELLGVRQIGVDDDFFELGGHSLHAVRLFAAIRKNYGVSLPLSTLFENASVRPLAALLEAQSPRQQSEGVTATSHSPAAVSGTGYSSLAPIQPLGTNPAFYCAAGMGGNPLNLRALALEMGIDQPFFGLQPQGLDGKSDLHLSIPEMAAHYVAEIRRVQPSGPYYLGGYSGGGVVAFEMAKQLTMTGERIGSLVFIDSIAPGVTVPPLRNRLDEHIDRLRKEGIAPILNSLKWAVDRRVKKVGVILRKPLRRVFPYHYRIETIHDTWNEAFAVYEPTSYAGGAMLFRASTGFVMGRDVGRMNGWDRLIGGKIEVSECPGDHSTMCEQPHVRVLARRLGAYLRRQFNDNKVRELEHVARDGHERSPALSPTDAGDQEAEIRLTKRS